jgi:hypothetical protein
MRKIHSDKGHGHDEKYSKWRREIFPKITGSTSSYCTDIDWIEWRYGKPVAIIECRRAIGQLKTAEDAIEHFKKLNNGFQYEVLARLAYELGIPAYIVGIQDPAPCAEDYSGARFVVEEVVPPEKWPSSRSTPSEFLTTKKVGEWNEQQYAEFIAGLGRQETS